MRLVIALATLGLLWSVPLVAQKRPFTPQDEYRIVSVAGASVSPAGDAVAFTVTTIDEAANARRSSVWLQELASGAPKGEPYRLTDPTRDSSSPSWSPDGALISFSSRRAEDNSTWFIRAKGAGEAFRVPGVEASPVWSSDSRWIAFTRAPAAAADEGRAERPGWIAPDAISRTLDPKRFDGRVITHARYKSDGTFPLLAHPSARGRPQLYVVPAAGGTAKQVTSTGFSVGDFDWAPDASWLVFVQDEEEDDDVSDHYTDAIYVVSRDGGTPRRITTAPGSHRSPALSPDGKRLAYLHTLKRGQGTDLFVVDLDAAGSFRGTPRNLTAAWELDGGSPTWSSDGRSIRFTTGIGGNTHLFEVPAAGGEVRQITSGDRQINGVDWSADGRVMAYLESTPLRPAEVHVARAGGADARRVTSFNDAWLAGMDLVSPEQLSWTVSDGSRIEGWVMKPVGWQPGKRYPMVLNIHGGPHGAYGNGFTTGFQMLSGAGFYVFYANPRGSTGYGNDFAYATVGGWGEKDKEDLEVGVSTVLAKYPDIDPARLGVTGGSYGGFMTPWMTARTKLFAAAVTRASIVEWVTQTTNGDIYTNKAFEFTGPFWEQRERYARLSPINYVEHVTAPTLIIHGEHDYRTPMAHAEQWYLALRLRGVPTELVRYPRSSHGIREPWLFVDSQERTRSWFVHWLIDQPTRRITATSNRN